jgi:hypothetical protein
MKRLMTGFGVAAAFGLVASLSAQTTTTPASQTSSDREMTITGCLERGANGNYTLTNARADNSMAGSATTTGTSGTTATGTTSATGTTTSGSEGTTAGAMNATAGTSWTLEGGSDLDKHVGHKIQVTGKEVPSKDKDEASATTTTSGATTTATGTTGTTGSAAGEQRHSTGDHAGHTLDVKSVKMISSSCS